MQDDRVARNLKGMDDLYFTGWNSADWDGVSSPSTTPRTCWSTGRVKNRLVASRSILMR